MAYDSRVFRILIASPTDVEEEREIAVRVIQTWNDLYSHTRKVTLLPLRWETHTAPEYNTRPQEVINRAIVDECDLLVGLFWTRVGSRTGVAESGTLEEIERVGRDKKPVMLYFSRVSADPESIDTDQITRLRDFKTKTFPNGLIEQYKSHIEFRDKFTRQLEMKVRELQSHDGSGQLPIRLDFISPETTNPIGRELSQKMRRFSVCDLDSTPNELRDALQQLVEDSVRKRLFAPIPFAITNLSSSAIRNLYVELDINVSHTATKITDSPRSYGVPPHRRGYTAVGVSSGFVIHDDETFVVPRSIGIMEEQFAKYENHKLQQRETGWHTTFEWEALQPQRTRLMHPILYAFAPETTEIRLRAKLFADIFPAPVELKGIISVEVVPEITQLDTLVPNWRRRLTRDMPQHVTQHATIADGNSVVFPGQPAPERGARLKKNT